MRAKRLQPGDRELAKALFALMAGVFDEACGVLGDPYLDRLLARNDFWALAAFDGNHIVGGITAHTLPMTRSETAELFIYDLAVRRDHWRGGVGRYLVAELRAVYLRVSRRWGPVPRPSSLDRQRANSRPTLGSRR